MSTTAITTALQVTSKTDLSGVPTTTLSDMYRVASAEIRAYERFVARGMRKFSASYNGRIWARFFRIEDELKSRGLV